MVDSLDSFRLFYKYVLSPLHLKRLSTASSAMLPDAQAAAGGGNSANIQQGLRTKLEQIIAANQLQHFYPPQALQAVLNRLNTVDFRCHA